MIARLAIGLAVLAAWLVFVFAVVGPRWPGVAVILLGCTPLYLLVQHDRRNYERQVRAAHRERLRERARLHAEVERWERG